MGGALLDIVGAGRQSARMPAESRHHEPAWPNKPTGLRGIEEMLVGRRRGYAHPALRWAARPVTLLVWALSVFLLGNESRSTAWLVVSTTLVAVSSVAIALNFWLMRRRNRAERANRTAKLGSNA
jgi:hypothetical protein